MAPHPPHHSSGSRRKYLGISTIIQHVQEARKMRDSTTNTTSSNAATLTDMSPLTNLSDLSLALDSTSAQTGPSDDKLTKNKGVHFNNKVSIFEIPAPEQLKASRVSFSEEVIDIDTIQSRSPSPTPSPPRKQVRFGCLKKSGVRAHFKHTPIYKIKTFEAIAPLLKPKKRVRFGCLKCEEPSTLTDAHAKDQSLMAEEAATFKRGLMGNVEMTLV